VSNRQWEQNFEAKIGTIDPEKVLNMQKSSN